MSADNSNETTGPEPYGSAPYGSAPPIPSPPPLMPYPQSAPQSRIGRNTVTFGVLIFLLIAVPVVVNAMTSGDRRPPPPVPQHTISLPASLNGYEHVSGNVADRLIADMRRSNGDNSPEERAIDQKATMAIYEKNKDFDRRFIVIGFSASDDPTLAKALRSGTPSRIVDQAFLGGGKFPDTQDFRPGQLGGVLRCSAGKGDSGELTMCVWVDGSTMGTIAAPGISVKDLADLTFAFRAGAET
jgi:hypothetical protein